MSMSMFRKVPARAFILIGSFMSLSATGTFAGTASVTYTYDKVGRITTAAYDNGECIAYAYDENGNRTAQTNTLSGAPSSPVWGSSVWGCFTWSSTGLALGNSRRLPAIASSQPHGSTDNAKSTPVDDDLSTADLAVATRTSEGLSVRGGMQ